MRRTGTCRRLRRGTGRQTGASTSAIGYQMFSRGGGRACHAGRMRQQSRRPDRSSEGRRTIDLAQGILIGRRRYSPGEAFGELLEVSRRHDITLTSAAGALVDLATGIDDGSPSTSMNAVIAEFEWGPLFGDITRVASAPRFE